MDLSSVWQGIEGQLPVLVIVMPLFSVFIISILGWYNYHYSYNMTIFTLFLTSLAALGTFKQVLEKGAIHYQLGGWRPPFGIDFCIDHLNGMVLVTVSVVAFLVAIYSKNNLMKEIPFRCAHFYTLFILLVTGLLGITVTGDVFNLYVLLEITALTTYALIAFGKKRAYMASFDYLILGTIGACFYLLGIGHLYLKTGSLNMYDLANIIPSLANSTTILVAFLFILVGIWVKMAFFPLHGWLPNAYAYSPTAVSCLVAPLATKVSVYVLLRLILSVFSIEYVFSQLNSAVMMWLAILAIVAGSLFALAQDKLKKTISYILVAEIGYMVGGIWLGNFYGMTGAIYHIVADAMMTLCLFMAIGCVVYRTGSSYYDAMQGVFRKMPLTSICFLIGAFSMIGIPPTCGFFSKWFLIRGALAQGHWGFIAAILFSSLVNAVLFFRVIEIGFFGYLDKEKHGESGHRKEGINEAPPSMLVPMFIAAASLIVIGFFTNEIVMKVIRFIVPLSLS